MSKYVMNWDVDELWIPPLSEIMNDETTQQSADLNGATKPRRNYLHQTELRNNDQLWLRSIYSNAMSLVEAVRVIREENGCADWCFQTLPSYTVH
jgi:hypothetical protein